MSPSSEERFFHYLLDKTNDAFQSSEVHERHPNSSWGFAVCDTPIQKGRPALLGLNWGDKDKTTQTEYPAAEKKREWHFVTHSRKYLKEYLGYDDVNTLNYSNLCFFRTPHVNSLPETDWSLALDLSEEYLDYIQPPLVVILGGGTAIPHLESANSDLIINWVEFNGKRVRVFEGALFGKFKCIGLPHPAYPLKKSHRRLCWSTVCPLSNQ